MESQSSAFPPGGVRFVFKGGPHDGETVKTPDGGNVNVGHEAQGLWALTKRGTIGRQFRQLAPGYWDALPKRSKHDDVPSTGIGPSHFHYYEIVANCEKNGAAVVECEYRGV